jgi:hypothetical protein
MKASIKQFVAMRQSLLTEKKALQARLSEIETALGVGEASVPAVAAPVVRAAVASRRTGKRIRNALSLKAAVVKVTKEKAMTKEEILAAIAKLGYRFNTGNPVSSLNSVLYAKKQFKNAGGKFSPL